MKKLSFILMLLCIGVYAYAKKAQPSDQVLSIAKLKPYQTAPEDVSYLGTPVKKQQNKDVTVWTYRSGSTELSLYWDMRVGRLEKYDFISTVFPNINWDRDYGCQLETGITTLQDAINLLGDPKDMFVGLNNQQLHYEFNGDVVLLFFYKDRLQQLQMHGKGNKKIG